MPSLGKHDGLAYRVIREVEEIDNARLGNECKIDTSKGRLQFGVECQRRMNAVLSTLKPADPTSTVEWGMADNSKVTLTFEELRDLITEADSLAGPKLIRAFQYAQLLKTRFRGGVAVTQREIAPENWV